MNRMCFQLLRFAFLSELCYTTIIYAHIFGIHNWCTVLSDGKRCQQNFVQFRFLFHCNYRFHVYTYDAGTTGM